MSSKTDQLEVFGALLMGYAQACVNLNIVAGTRAAALTAELEVNQWYPFARLKELEEIVLKAYADNAPIMERVGIEVMSSWYHHGPGKHIISRGIDFLTFQTGSEGYQSVVKGPEHLVGRFFLESSSEDAGTARIHSTTPLNRDMERGVIIGGMMAPGDLDYVDVQFDEASQTFNVEYH